MLHYRYAEPEEGPPHPPVGGGASRMLRGLMLRRRAVLGTPMRKICWSPGLRPGPRWGSLQRSPRLPIAGAGGEGGFAAPLPKNPTYNIVIVLVLCVCTHVYENALLFSREC